MVRVQTLFNRVRDLSRKDKAGYSSAVEFNRDLAEVQDILMEYYYMMFEMNEMGLDSLSPFIVEKDLVIANQFCEFPNDYRYKLECGYVFSQNVNTKDCKVKNPILDYKEAQHLRSNEVLKTINSPIRKPKLGRKYAYEFVNNKIKVYPRELVGYWHLKYIIDPPVATYAVTVNQATDEEDYDAQNSIDLIWNRQDQHNLVDLLLFFKGIEIRESLLLQWVQQKYAFKKRPA